MGQLGGGGERVGRGDDNAEGEEGEVENWDMEGWRAENEGNAVLGEGREMGLEGQGEGLNLVEEVRVRDSVVGGGVNEERGGGSGGSMEEGASVVSNGDWLRRWW